MGRNRENDKTIITKTENHHKCPLWQHWANDVKFSIKLFFNAQNFINLQLELLYRQSCILDHVKFVLASTRIYKFGSIEPLACTDHITQCNSVDGLMHLTYSIPFSPYLPHFLHSLSFFSKYFVPCFHQ